jgi:hypothetical protein
LKNSLQQTLSSYHYEYNKLEQLIKVTEEDADYYDYTYDDAGRLTHEDKRTPAILHSITATMGMILPEIAVPRTVTVPRSPIPTTRAINCLPAKARLKR